MTLNRSCPACQSSHAGHFGAHDEVSIQKCLQCGTIYFERPVPKVNDYTQYYPYLRTFNQKRIATELKIREGQTRAKIRYIQGLLPSFGNALLDIGAGPGYFVAQCVKEGIDAYGVEPNVEARMYGERNFGVRYLALEDIQSATFDVITMYHVLEHLEYPREFLVKCWELLRPGGILSIQVPVAESLSGRASWWVKSRLGATSGRRGNLYLPDHLTGFTKQGLDALVRESGFAPKNVSDLTQFSDDHDPWFLGLQPSFVASLQRFVDTSARAAIDLLSGGCWIRLLAVKAAKAGSQ